MARTRPMRSQGGRLRREFHGFSGGFVTARAPSLLTDDEFHYGTNADLFIDGSVRKRAGYAKNGSIATLGNDGIIGAYEFRDDAGNAPFFIVHSPNGAGPKLYRENDTANGYKHVRVALRGPVGVTAAVNGSAGGAEFTVSNDYLYVVVPYAANTTYANGQAAEVAYVQQTNPVQDVDITWKALRFAEGYRVYRYHSGRGWELLGSTTAVTFTDTGALGPSAAFPPVLPTDHFHELPVGTPTRVRFTTALNNCIFSDGRSLYRYGQHGIDLLPAAYSDFETSVPAAYLFTVAATATAASSTNWAYSGTKSLLITFNASADYVELNWPLRTGLANGEVVRVTGRYVQLAKTANNGVQVEIAVLDSGGTSLQTSTVNLTPEIVTQQFNLAHTLTTANGDRLRIRIKQNGTYSVACPVYLDDFHVYIDAAEVLRPYVPTASEVTSIGANLLLTATDPIWQSTLLAAHANQLWLAGVPDNTTRAHFSNPVTYDYFPASYYALAKTYQDDRITAIYEHRNRLILFTRDTTQRITGSDASDYAWNLVNGKIGCIAPESVAQVDNWLAWVGRDGIYIGSTTDGIENFLDVQRISDPIQPTFYDMPTPEKAVGVYHAGQYKVHFPAASATTTAYTLRWYKPGEIRERGVWTCPDQNKLSFSTMAVRTNGKLYAANRYTGLVYYLNDVLTSGLAFVDMPSTNTSWTDDGTEHTFEMWKLINLGEPVKRKEIYNVAIQAPHVSSTEWTVDVKLGTIALDSSSNVASTTVSKTLTWKSIGVTALLGFHYTSWQSAEARAESELFLLRVVKATGGYATVQSLAIEYRLGRG